MSKKYLISIIHIALFLFILTSCSRLIPSYPAPNINVVIECPQCSGCQSEGNKILTDNAKKNDPSFKQDESSKTQDSETQAPKVQESKPKNPPPTDKPKKQYNKEEAKDKKSPPEKDMPKETIITPKPTGKLLVNLEAMGQQLDKVYTLTDEQTKEKLPNKYRTGIVYDIPIGNYTLEFEGQNYQVECSKDDTECNGNKVKIERDMDILVQYSLLIGELRVVYRDGECQESKTSVIIQGRSGAYHKKETTGKVIELPPDYYIITLDELNPNVKREILIKTNERKELVIDGFGQLIVPIENTLGLPLSGQLIIRHLEEGWSKEIKPGKEAVLPAGKYDIKVKGDCGGELLDIIVNRCKLTKTEPIEDCCQLLIKQGKDFVNGDAVFVKRGISKTGRVGKPILLPCDIEVDIEVKGKEALDIIIIDKKIEMTADDFN